MKDQSFNFAYSKYEEPLIKKNANTDVGMIIEFKNFYDHKSIALSYADSDT